MGHGHANGGGDDEDKLGDFSVGRFHHSLKRIKRLVFIRHGEKLDEAEYGKTPGLDDEGKARANNLYRVFGGGPGSLFTPDVIYAMKQGHHETTNSNRPYLTVAPLAERLGLTIDESFTQKQRADLVQRINNRAHDGDFNDKTVLFCWEHKNIPYIIGELGLSDHELHWGLDPESGADDRDNYTAIWSFTPDAGGLKLQVYKEFEVEPGNPAKNELPRIVPPQNDDYTKVVWEKEE